VGNCYIGFDFFSVYMQLAVEMEMQLVCFLGSCHCHSIPWHNPYVGWCNSMWLYISLHWTHPDYGN